MVDAHRFSGSGNQNLERECYLEQITLRGAKNLTRLARGNLSEKKTKVLIHLPFLPSTGLLQGVLIGQTQLEAKGKRNMSMKGQPPQAERNIKYVREWISGANGR